MPWTSDLRGFGLTGSGLARVHCISLPHLEAWSHKKAWSEKITLEIEAPASIRGNTVLMNDTVADPGFGKGGFMRMCTVATTPPLYAHAHRCNN